MCKLLCLFVEISLNVYLVYNWKNNFILSPRPPENLLMGGAHILSRFMDTNIYQLLEK